MLLAVARCREALAAERAAVRLPAHMSAQVGFEITEESLVFLAQVTPDHRFFNHVALEKSRHSYGGVVFR